MTKPRTFDPFSLEDVRREGGAFTAGYLLYRAFHHAIGVVTTGTRRLFDGADRAEDASISEDAAEREKEDA